mmetsp:Transcript_90324/g.159931  ORF Transcript_90324/g.159931 Transcript_90324/m.159931 type:complete len:250 (+) Transcript_90324:206-955(+)
MPWALVENLNANLLQLLPVGGLVEHGVARHEKGLEMQGGSAACAKVTGLLNTEGIACREAQLCHLALTRLCAICSDNLLGERVAAYFVRSLPSPVACMVASARLEQVQSNIPAAHAGSHMERSPTCIVRVVWVGATAHEVLDHREAPCSSCNMQHSCAIGIGNLWARPENEQPSEGCEIRRSSKVERQLIQVAQMSNRLVEDDAGGIAADLRIQLRVDATGPFAEQGVIVDTSVSDATQEGLVSHGCAA